MIKKSLLVSGLAAVLTACGGGGSDSSGTTSPSGTTPKTVSAEGLWVGTTDDNRDLAGVVLSDGTYYILYTASQSAAIAGVIQGTGQVSGDQFISGNAVDFNFQGAGINPATAESDVVTGQSMNGSIRYASGTRVAYIANYDPDFDKKPSLGIVAGKFEGQVVTSAGQESADLEIAADGTLDGRGASGCALTGRITPRQDGNVYDITATFGGTPCLFAGQTFSGIGYYVASESSLVAVAPNARRDNGILFIGGRP